MVNGNHGHGRTRLQLSREHGYPIRPNPAAAYLRTGDSVVLNFADDEARTACAIGTITDRGRRSAFVEWDLDQFPADWYELESLIAVKG